MTGLPAWIALAIVLALLAATPFAAHIPGVREWTGAAPLERESDRPDHVPGGTLRHALDYPEYLDDLPGRDTR